MSKARTNKVYKTAKSDVCFYCGDPFPTTRDHVIPVSSNLRIDELMFTVPCCSDCNNRLSKKIYFCMSQRANHLLKCLTGKLKAQPVWTDQELSELGDALRKRVETKIKTDANLLERCNYLKERVALLKKAEEVLED